MSWSEGGAGQRALPYPFYIDIVTKRYFDGVDNKNLDKVLNCFTPDAVLTELKARCRANMPADIRIATVWYKPARNQTALKPDYFIHESNEWLVFPHEIDGLTTEEIRAHKPAADVILAPIEGLKK